MVCPYPGDKDQLSYKICNKFWVHIRGQHERSVRRSPWFGLGIYAQLVFAIGYISVQCPRTFIAALSPHLYL